MEFYITARSNAAPFISDSSDAYIEAPTAREALEKFVDAYSHPCGLYAAEVWGGHKQYSLGGDPPHRYLSGKELARRKAIAGKSGYTSYSDGPAHLEIDGQEIHFDPEAGQII